MLNGARLQLAGPISVIATILGAQLCAHALAQWPTSSLAWYLNLEVFRPFRYGIDCVTVERWLGGDGLSQSSWIAVPLLVLLGGGLLLKSRLAVAIACHLGLVYSALILYGSCDLARSAVSFAGASALRDPSNFLASAILLASVLSSTISHREYWREIISCRGTPNRFFRSYKPDFAYTRVGAPSGTGPQQLPSFSISA